MDKTPSVRTSHEGFQPNWFNISFLIPLHLAGLTLWPLYLFFGGDIRWPEIAVGFFMYALSVFGINIGYHRAFSHRAFKMSKPFKWLALVGGASAMEGSVLTWCSDHRRHHKFEDTDQDPYNIKRGFWWAHIGWILGSPTSSDFSNVPDLNKDPLIRNQNRYRGLWMILCSFGIPIFLGFLLGRPLQCFLVGGLTRLLLVNHFTYLINSYAHYFGRRPYSVEITARDSWLCAFLAQGEGWHNFHHRFPFDYRCGPKWWQWDSAKWVIALGRYVGLTSDLKETPAVEIYRAKLQTEYYRHAPKLEAKDPVLTSMTETLERAFERWHELSIEAEQEWKRLKADWSREKAKQVKVIRQKMHKAQRDFQWQYAVWRRSLVHA